MSLSSVPPVHAKQNPSVNSFSSMFFSQNVFLSSPPPPTSLARPRPLLTPCRPGVLVPPPVCWSSPLPSGSQRKPHARPSHAPETPPSEVAHLRKLEITLLPPSRVLLLLVVILWSRRADGIRPSRSADAKWLSPPLILYSHAALPPAPRVCSPLPPPHLLILFVMERTPRDGKTWAFEMSIQGGREDKPAQRVSCVLGTRKTSLD